MQYRDQDDDRLTRSRERYPSQDVDDEKPDDNDRKFFSKYNPKNVSLALLTAVCMLFILVTTKYSSLTAHFILIFVLANHSVPIVNGLPRRQS